MSADFRGELVHVLNGEEALYTPKACRKWSPGFQVKAFQINLRGRVAFSMLQGLPQKHHHINHSYWLSSPFPPAYEGRVGQVSLIPETISKTENQDEAPLHPSTS